MVYWYGLLCVVCIAVPLLYMYGAMTISTICTDSHYKTCNGVVVHTIVYVIV